MIARPTPSGPAPDEVSADQRLARYRSMRDFTVTSEPSGTEPPPPSGNRFVVQRHRATRLHYDLRLEADGVLLSWAVPRGPTLDPDVRRMAVHVEDHPLGYFDFEGVIPTGEYGGGDVIVWDWGTWELAEGDHALGAIERGEVHFDLFGEKLRGRFVLVRRGSRGAANRRADTDHGDDKGQWLLVHKHDDHAVSGWDPEDLPRSVKSGRTNEEVADAPSATWSGAKEWVGPTPDALEALDALPARGGRWEFGPHSLRLTNLDKVLFRGSGSGRDNARDSDRSRELTKRDLVRYYASIAPAMLPYLAARPVNMHRYPDGVHEAGFWHKAAPGHAPEWLTRWRNEEAGPGDTAEYLILDEPAALAWAANFGAVELHPWTSTAAEPHQPSWALIDIDPGADATFDDALVLARLYRTALDHLGLQAAPKVTGGRGIHVWVPVAHGYGFDDTRAFVETISRAVGATVPELVSWEWETAKRAGLSRLDYTQNAINKTLVAPFSVRATDTAPVSVPISWDELDDPDLRPDRWTIRDAAERVASAGDPLAPLVGLQQQLPQL